MSNCQELERKRLFRIICIALGLLLLPIILAVVLLFATGRTQSEVLFAVLILLVTEGIATASILFKAYGLTMGEKGIFHMSGDPPKMVEALYQSLFLESQTLILILLIGLMSVLLVVKAVDANVGVPVIGTAAGVGLGRQFLGGQIGGPRGPDTKSPS